MKITLKDITIRELYDGYVDSVDLGVYGYGGKLNIRPAFQREFVYKDAQRDAVIYTVLKGFPLNVMYWSKNADGTFELIDGQQRTISICQYVAGDFSIKYNDHQYTFVNLPNDIKESILSYVAKIYVCEGTESEKLDWFKIINTAGEKLTHQEMRNAVYSGTWVTDAKRYFSKRDCPAWDIGKKYLNGTPIRQEYLEKAIKWIANGKIDEYMALHQHDKNADELWHYFEDIIRWIERYFPVYRAKVMKGLPWGEYFNDNKDKELDKEDLESAISRLLIDDEIGAHSGIYAYLLYGDEKYLSLRAFPDDIAQAVYDKQKGICKACGKHFQIDEMEADHIIPWHDGGKTVIENCQMLCRHCNRVKGGK